jgi:hypothetical protein
VLTGGGQFRESTFDGGYDLILRDKSPELGLSLKSKWKLGLMDERA